MSEKMRVTDKELADQLDAQDRLIARGYTRKTCDSCRGVGQLPGIGECYSCEGRGFHWYAPITK
jgi:DnaJ-class molecular chaperone